MWDVGARAVRLAGRGLGARRVPACPVLRRASEISCPVEMAAGDAAARLAHRLTLAGALRTLAAARVRPEPSAPEEPPGAQRIQRLIG